ncbi:hypothetical protein RFM99_11935 [Mesorhizobium sp. VK4C]|uniref:hypothetical protein n=1 Tax=Mesorhizobium captivum TaxID=3072319 RepID=UPI002A244908|nr:hypothetical protein [Mesorhizobium sp. VK4C]MDX8499127.1 hypothetical protein [Mesorhizobium sp. VK4C]
MFLDPAENLVSPKRQEADELIDRIREWGDHPDTVDAFRSTAEKTLSWLKKNQVPDAWLKPDRSYSKLPDPDASSNLIRWWPTPKKFDDAAMAEARRVLLRQRAYDLGMLYFLRALASAGRIEISRDELVDEILMPSTYFGLNQLLAFSRLKALDPESYGNLSSNVREKNGVSLNAVAELFGITSKHRAILFRKKLVRLGSLGIVSGSKRLDDGLDVELGPSGVAFFAGVYVPIINHMPLQQE